MRWLTNFYDFRYKWILQQELKYTLLNPDCHSWWISKMKSGCEDTLAERYAIKFSFKLGKNATETYGMLQTAFRPSCMNRASVFEWHKRFKEGGESVRDDEIWGRRKDVRTPKLIGQIKNFMDKDRRVSIETISAQCGNCTHNYSRRTDDADDLREVYPKGAQRRSERKTLLRQQGDGRADQFSSWCSGDLRWKLDLVLWPRDQETEFPVEVCWLSQTQEGQTEQILPQTFDGPFFDSTGMIYMHWVPTGQTVNKEYYAEVLREFKKRFRQKKPALFKSGQWHFHQDNAPVHNSSLVTDYLTKIGIKMVPHPPCNPDFAACDFWLFPKLKKKLRGDERGCDEGHRGLPWGLPEVVGTVHQVHFSWRRLLRRGQEFHECTINKSAHTKKVWKFI